MAILKKKKEPELKLRVAEAIQDDVNKGIVRVDSQKLKELGIAPNSFIEISNGDKKTVAIAARALPADIGLALIRMDGFTRKNSGSSIGEHVVIKSANVKPAKRVAIAPTQKGIMIQANPETFRRYLLGRAITKGDIISLGGTNKRRRALSGSPFEEIFRMLEDPEFNTGIGMFGDLRFVVTSTNPKEAVYVTEDTELALHPEAIELEAESVPQVTYEDIGGLNEETKKVRELIELPLKHPEIFERLGIQPPKGVLLHGPPGTGKTLLAKAVASESQARFISLNGPEIMSKFVGEAEKKLRAIFDEAEKNSPSIIFIDEIDAIAPKREESYGEVERRVVAQLLAVMDGLKARGKVIVIAATNRPDALDPALRRGGRFDREIEIGVPDRKGRLEILKIHTRNMPWAMPEEEVKKFKKELANMTHGFVGADLEGLAKEAAMSVLRRVTPDFNFKENDHVPKEVLEKLQVTKHDFKEALKMVRPSAMREVLIETPRIKWEQVGGLEKAKQELKEAVEWPLTKPEIFKRMGIRPPKGVLLYGPSGCGKTLLVKAVATASEANFISVKGSEVLSKWVGESEKAIRDIFKKARQVSPAIIFFDEIDSIATKRGTETGVKVGERVVNSILTEMDGLEELTDVVVIAATNKPELMDSALLRPGRFDRQILICDPDIHAREFIFKIHTKGIPLAKDINLKELAELTEGYSGADIEGVAREATMIALREDQETKQVKKEHFVKAMEAIRPSLKKEEIDKYKKRIEAVKQCRDPGYIS